MGEVLLLSGAISLLVIFDMVLIILTVYPQAMGKAVSLLKTLPTLSHLEPECNYGSLQPQWRFGCGLFLGP